MDVFMLGSYLLNVLNGLDLARDCPVDCPSRRMPPRKDLSLTRSLPETFIECRHVVTAIPVSGDVAKLIEHRVSYLHYMFIVCLMLHTSNTDILTE